MLQHLPAKASFKQQMLPAREAAIIQAVNRLLAAKGFDAMTVEEVANQVGVAKASLYKHYPTKEDLAAAAMVNMLRRMQEVVSEIADNVTAAPLDKLKAVARWVMAAQLAGEMPSLPRPRSSLRANLVGNAAYRDGLKAVSDALRVWIEAAQASGVLSPEMPAIAVLYTLYARACDPVLEFLKASGEYTAEQLIDLVVSTCFDGLRARSLPATSLA